MEMSHQGLDESAASGNADVSADHKGTFAREAAKREKQISTGRALSGDSGYGSIIHSPSQDGECYYQTSGCVTPSGSIDWESPTCPGDEFEHQRQEKFVDFDFFFLSQVMWLNGASESSYQVRYKKVHTSDVQIRMTMSAGIRIVCLGRGIHLRRPLPFRSKLHQIPHLGDR